MAANVAGSNRESGRCEGTPDVNSLPHERVLGVDQRVGDVVLPLAIVLLDPRPVHE